VDQHFAERADCVDEAVVGEGERLPEAAEADRDHQRTDVVSGTSSPDVEPGGGESPADPERQRRIGAPVDVVPAVEDDHDGSDAEHESNDGNSDQGSARAAHLMSKLIASALSSPLGMKPRAALASIVLPRFAAL